MVLDILGLYLLGGGWLLLEYGKLGCSDLEEVVDFGVDKKFVWKLF